jgi:hypothetical protein
MESLNCSRRSFQHPTDPNLFYMVDGSTAGNFVRSAQRDWTKVPCQLFVGRRPIVKGCAIACFSLSLEPDLPQAHAELLAVGRTGCPGAAERAPFAEIQQLAW